MTKQITNIAQFKPLLKSRGRIGMDICETANTTEAYAGEYSVRITFNGCAINAKTTLAINSCDNLYIKAFNPLTNVETNKLIRKPNVAAKNEYEDLILQVETLDGKIIKTMDYAWTPPAGVTLVPNPNEPYKVQTNKLGRYTVQASSANGTNCPLSIDIFAEPCTIVGDAFNCNSTGGSTIDVGQTDLANLAVGDEFTTSDYTIVVTEASKTGTTFSGKGKLIFNFLKISNTLALQIPISVTFTGIKINQCYQLYSGKVVTEYDESWGSVVSADQIKNQLSGVYTQIKDLLLDPTANIVALQNKIKDLRAARADLANADFTAEYKAEQLAALDAAITGMVCLVGEPPATGSRMSAALNSKTCDASSVGASIDAAKAAGENSQINKWAGDVFDESSSAGRIESESKELGNFVIIKSIKNGKTKYDLLGDYHVDHMHDENENWKIPIRKLMTYYYSKIENPNKPVVTFDVRKQIKDKKYKEALAFCIVPDDIICLDISEGYIHTSLDNRHVLLSVLTHEQFHAFDPVESKFPKDYKHLNHMNVYLNQIKDKNFLKVPNYYRDDTFSNILDYAKLSEKEDGNNSTELLNFINKELNVYCQKNFNRRIIREQGVLNWSHR